MGYAEGGVVAGGPSDDDHVPMLAPGYRAYLTDGERVIRSDGRIYVWHIETGWMDTGETLDFGLILSTMRSVLDAHQSP